MAATVCPLALAGRLRAKSGADAKEDTVRSIRYVQPNLDRCRDSNAHWVYRRLRRSLTWDFSDLISEARPGAQPLGLFPDKPWAIVWGPT
jgi:hypothetical protein